MAQWARQSHVSYHIYSENLFLCFTPLIGVCDLKSEGETAKLMLECFRYSGLEIKEKVCVHHLGGIVALFAGLRLENLADNLCGH